MTSTMSTELEQGRSYVEKTHGGVTAAIEQLSEAQWTFKPAPDRWSIAEVVEHVVIVQELVLGPIAERLANAPLVENHDSTTVDAIVLNQFPDRTRRFPAPERARPTGGWTPSAALDRLNANCGRLIGHLESTPDLRQHTLESQPLIAMTGGAYRYLDGYEWFLAAAAHTERHTRQILEVRADPNFPSA